MDDGDEVVIYTAEKMDEFRNSSSKISKSWVIMGVAWLSHPIIITMWLRLVACERHGVEKSRGPTLRVATNPALQEYI